MFKRTISFGSKLGQRKNGVQYGPCKLKNYNCSVKCMTGNNLFDNLRNLYNLNCELKDTRLNIGGDHSMSIATIAYSLNKYPDTKVVWVDAHADINTFDKSASKNYHGMPLAYLTNLDKNHKFSFIKNKLDFNNLYYIGIRDLDDFEKNIIKEKNIKYISSYDFNRGRFGSIWNFMENSPIHLSIDVDGLDPYYFPSTGTPVENGLEKEMLLNFLEEIKYSNIVNGDLCEFNPYIGSKEDKEKSLNMWNEIYDKLIIK